MLLTLEEGGGRRVGAGRCYEGRVGFHQGRLVGAWVTGWGRKCGNGKKTQTRQEQVIITDGWNHHTQERVSCPMTPRVREQMHSYLHFAGMETEAQEGHVSGQKSKGEVSSSSKAPHQNFPSAVAGAFGQTQR